VSGVGLRVSSVANLKDKKSPGEKDGRFFIVKQTTISIIERMKRRNVVLILASSFLILSPLFFSSDLGKLFIPDRVEDIIGYADLRELTILADRETEFFSSFEMIKEKAIEEKSDFIEVHLSEMKISLYQEGVLSKEVPIMKKGDIKNWGGSAAGLYDVIAKYRISYSVVSEVYMPYAVHYYGKYYIHGEPYYPSGTKLDSPVSGGCLRLKDEDAEQVYNFAEKNMPVIVIDKENDDFRYPKTGETEFPQLSAESYLIADLNSGYIFQKKGIEKQMPIASLTKLMTALVVAEQIDLTKSILIKESMLEPYGCSDLIEEGERLRVIELFYPLLVESCNDAAEALSYFLGRERILELMEDKAKSILMKNTSFSDSSGLSPDNISTAQDLFYLARYILNNRSPLLDITKGKEVRTFGEVPFDIKELWNKNIFANDPTFVGGKTGFIKVSGYNGLFVFHLETKEGIERNVVIVLLNSQSLAFSELDAQRAYIWLLDNYFKENIN
jgi:hypothetical protein